MFNYIRGNASSVAAALQHYDFVFVAERMDEGVRYGVVWCGGPPLCAELQPEQQPWASLSTAHP